MLVTVILTVFIALSVPRFERVASSLRIKNDAFTLYKSIQFARERALIEGREFQIRFSFSNGDYRILKGPDFEPTKDRLGRFIRLSGGVSLEGQKDRLACYPDGNCDVSKFRLTNPEGVYDISVGGLGGTVRIEEVSA